MSLNITYSETKPCTKPYQLTLNDCLACSSCLTQNESNSLLLFDYKKIREYEKITITPHAKINLSTQFDIPFDTFEDYLCAFFDYKLIDTSHYYQYIATNEDNIITSECPGVVKYVQRLAHHLIDNLMKIKSTQQIIESEFRCLHIVTCLDKRLENISNYITTREIYKYLLESGFGDYITQNNKMSIQSDTHRTVRVDLGYIENICSKDVKITNINENWTEYRDGNKSYAKICGLPNFINFVRQSKKGMHYNVVEAYICKFGCINGPAQLQETIDASKQIALDRIEIILYDQVFVETNKRTFMKEQAKTKTYKVSW